MPSDWTPIFISDGSTAPHHLHLHSKFAEDKGLNQSLPCSTCPLKNPFSCHKDDTSQPSNDVIDPNSQFNTAATANKIRTYSPEIRKGNHLFIATGHKNRSTNEAVQGKTHGTSKAWRVTQSWSSDQSSASAGNCKSPLGVPPVANARVSAVDAAPASADCLVCLFPTRNATPRSRFIRRQWIGSTRMSVASIANFDNSATRITGRGGWGGRMTDSTEF